MALQKWEWGSVTDRMAVAEFIRLCNTRLRDLHRLLRRISGDPVFYADEYPGADWGAKVQAAHNAMPATGGTLDATRLTGTQTASVEVAISKPITLLLGRMTLTCALDWLSVTASGVTIEGKGRYATLVTCSTPWDGTNLFGVEVTAVRGFTARRFGLTMHRTGAAVFVATNCMGIYVHDDAGHTVGSTDVLIEDVDIESSGTEPDSQMRYLGIFGWTTNTGPPILTGKGFRVIGCRVHDTDGRCIELALCDNASIIGNTVTAGGSAATIVCVGVRIIGCENVVVAGNSIDITGGATLGNADCLQINGDNVSTNIAFTGNTCRTNADGGTGIKIGGNASHVTCVGNDVLYNGVSNALYGILVTSNPGAPEVPPTNILVDGNRVSGFGSQLGIDREAPGDTYPDTVAFTNNQLGTRWDGAALLGNFYNLNAVDIYTNNILLHGNHVASTSLATMLERFQGLVQAAAFQVGLLPAQQGSFRVENGSSKGMYGRNAANTADIALIAATSSDNVYAGGTGAVNVGVSNGTDVAQMVAGGHWRPGANGTQSLGASNPKWLDLWLAGNANIKTTYTWPAASAAGSLTNDGAGTLTWTAGGGAPTTASYLTLGLDGTLSNERVLTAGSNISFVDTGANGTLTINASGGAGTFFSQSIDFGTASPTPSAVVATVADAGVGAASKFTLAVRPGSGRDLDEMELGPVSAYIGNVVNGVSFDILAVSQDDTAHGTYLVECTRS
jgi:hypothetical protein